MSMLGKYAVLFKERNTYCFKGKKSMYVFSIVQFKNSTHCRLIHESTTLEYRGLTVVEKTEEAPCFHVYPLSLFFFFCNTGV
jgi:hypothetical protein